MITHIGKQLATQIVDTVHDVCGHDINFINKNGLIYASTNTSRIGSFHEIGKKAAAVMANTAIATAGDVPAMAEAFKKAIEAGRSAYLSGLGRTIERGASASSPLTGFLQD